MNSIRTYVFMDLETTGIPSHENNKTRITEISFVAVKRSHILDTKCGFTPQVQNKLTLCLNPRKMVHPGSTETTGLCNDLLEFEPSFNLQVFTILDNFLSVLASPVCLIAQNGLNFDYPILKKHLEDLKLNFHEDLLCADSFHAFYDILNAKQDRKQNEDVPNIFAPECPNKPTGDNIEVPDSTKELDDLFTKSDCIDMQKRNETTPKQQLIKTNYTPSKEKSLNRAPSKARRKFPWSVGEKPKVSYKLKDIYERLLQRPALNAHRAEADCVMTLECAVALSKQFVEWVDDNYVSFKDVKSMTIGVPLGS